MNWKKVISVLGIMCALALSGLGEYKGLRVSYSLKSQYGSIIVTELGKVQLQRYGNTIVDQFSLKDNSVAYAYYEPILDLLILSVEHTVTYKRVVKIVALSQSGFTFGKEVIVQSLITRIAKINGRFICGGLDGQLCELNAKLGVVLYFNTVRRNDNPVTGLTNVGNRAYVYYADGSVYQLLDNNRLQYRFDCTESYMLSTIGLENYVVTISKDFIRLYDSTDNLVRQFKSFGNYALKVGRNRLAIIEDCSSYFIYDPDTDRTTDTGRIILKNRYKQYVRNETFDIRGYKLKKSKVLSLDSIKGVNSIVELKRGILYAKDNQILHYQWASGGKLVTQLSEEEKVLALRTSAKKYFSAYTTNNNLYIYDRATGSEITQQKFDDEYFVNALPGDDVVVIKASDTVVRVELLDLYLGRRFTQKNNYLIPVNEVSHMYTSSSIKDRIIISGDKSFMVYSLLHHRPLLNQRVKCPIRKMLLAKSSMFLLDANGNLIQYWGSDYSYCDTVKTGVAIISNIVNNKFMYVDTKDSTGVYKVKKQGVELKRQGKSFGLLDIDRSDIILTSLNRKFTEFLVVSDSKLSMTEKYNSHSCFMASYTENNKIHLFSIYGEEVTIDLN